MSLKAQRVIGFLCVVLVPVCGRPAFAGVDRWTQVGPIGARMVDFAADPADSSRLFVATTGGGIYRSEDRGLSWQAANVGLPLGAFADSLAAAPGSPSLLFCVASGSGSPRRLYRSSDGGASWQGLGALDGISVFAPARLAVSPSNPSLLLLGGLTIALRRSSDGGATSIAVGPNDVRKLAFDPTDAQRAYAGRGTGLVRSIDGGATWGAAVAGLPVTTVWDLAPHPSVAGRIFAATSAGMYLSTDFGATWAPSTLGLSTARTVTFDPMDSSRLVADNGGGQFLSTDGGASWTRIVSTPAIIRDFNGFLRFLPDRSELVLSAGNDQGLWRSLDLGTTWTESSEGLNAADIRALAFDPTDSNRVYAGGGGSGIYRSLDGGQNWRAVRTTGDVRALAVDPSSPNIVWAAAVPQILRSLDFGATWATMPNPTGASFLLLTSLDLAPQDSSRMLVGADNRGIYLSQNGGSSYAQVGPQTTNIGVEAVLFDPLVPGRAFLALHLGGVYRSFDDGGSWEGASNGMDGAGLNSLALDPLRPDVLYAGGSSSFFTSSDGASSWTASPNPPIAALNAIAPHPRAPGLLYAGGNTGGVFVSRDAGKSWETDNEGLTNLWVTAIAIDPQRPWRMLVATWGQGIFERTQLSIFADGFERGDASAWSVVEP